MRALPVMFICLALTGCKTDLMTPITVSQLLADTPGKVMADLQVEVVSCESHEDSRLESDTLLKAKAEVINILPKAEFVECYTKRMDSFAHFKTPVVVGKGKGVKEMDSSYFYILSNPDSKLLAGVRVPEEIKKKLELSKKKAFGVGSNDFNIIINLKNDTDSVFDFAPLALYIDGNPLISSYGRAISLSKGGVVNIKLSDVSVSSALDSRIKSAPVLMSPEKTEEK